MNLTYKYTDSADKGLTVTVLYNMRPYSYTQESHTDFYGLIGALRNYTKVYPNGDYLEKAKAVIDFLRPEFMRSLVETNPKLTFKDDSIYYGDEQLNGLIINHILKFRKQKLPFEPYWAFLEKLMSNPDARSREQLYTFIQNNDFPPLTMDGDILAYKGLNADGTSIHRGYGIVNGVEFENDYLQNDVDNVISMPRHKVDSDPSSACSYGLHVGSLTYVRGFARGKIVVVKVNPRDVVSVPADCSFQKIRCCLYTVVSEFDGNEIKETLIKDKYADNLEKKLADMIEDGVDNEFHLTNRALKRLHPESTGQERKDHFDKLLPIARSVLQTDTKQATPVNQPDPKLDELIKVVSVHTSDILPAVSLADFKTNVYVLGVKLNKTVAEISDLSKACLTVYDFLDKQGMDELTTEEWTRNFSR